MGCIIAVSFVALVNSVFITTNAACACRSKLFNNCTATFSIVVQLVVISVKFWFVLVSAFIAKFRAVNVKFCAVVAKFSAVVACCIAFCISCNRACVNGVFCGGAGGAAPGGSGPISCGNVSTPIDDAISLCASASAVVAVVLDVVADVCAASASAWAVLAAVDATVAAATAFSARLFCCIAKSYCIFIVVDGAGGFAAACAACAAAKYITEFASSCCAFCCAASADVCAAAATFLWVCASRAAFCACCTYACNRAIGVLFGPVFNNGVPKVVCFSIDSIWSCIHWIIWVNIWFLVSSVNAV